MLFADRQVRFLLRSKNAVANPEEQAMQRQSILVVEDEEDIRELISYNLTREGYEVVAVESGEEALKEEDH